MMHKDYVCCDKCYKNGQKLKPKVNSIFAIMPNDVLFKVARKFKTVEVLVDFYNGIVYKMPLCCNIHFCCLIFKGLRPAITSSILQGAGVFNPEDLTAKERKYILGKGGTFVD